ncbi:hypothetical protein ABZP36_025722, partial [Zizania latifolia]
GDVATVVDVALPASHATAVVEGLFHQLRITRLYVLNGKMMSSAMIDRCIKDKRRALAA